MLLRYLPAIVIGAVVAVLTATASVLILLDHPAALLVVLYAPLPGIVLLPALLLAWLYALVRDRGRTPWVAHLAMLGPAVLAALIVPAGQSLRRQHDGLFGAPPVSEVHVNLTGQTLWLDDSVSTGFTSTPGIGHVMPVPALPVGQTTQVTRWPPVRRADGRAFPYAGHALKPSRLQIGRALGDGRPSPDVVPLRRPSAALPRDLPARDLRHVYYHYPDHVDVVLTPIRSPLLVRTPARRAPAGLTLVSVADSSTVPIVRLELNGQNVDLLHADLAQATCPNRREPQAPVVLGTDTPLTVRWQRADAPQHWHEAQLAYPALPLPSGLAKQAYTAQLMLYFSDALPPAVQRFQEVPTGDIRLSLATSPAPAAYATVSACADVASGYDLQVVTPL